MIYLHFNSLPGMDITEYVPVISAPLFAHHGAASFDIEKKVVLKGTVKEWLYSNPHCLLTIEVKGEDGKGPPPPPPPAGWPSTKYGGGSPPKREVSPSGTQRKEEGGGKRGRGLV